MDKLRVAVIGTGFVGRVHVENIRRQNDAEVVAIADQTAELAATFGRTLGIPRTAGDYRELLDDSSIDAVHICTPNKTHFPIARDALDALRAVADARRDLEAQVVARMALELMLLRFPAVTLAAEGAPAPSRNENEP